MAVIDKMFYRNISQQDINHIIQLELVNQILHKKSSNLHEAISAYSINLYETLFMNPQDTKEFKILDFGLTELKDFENIMAIFYEDSQAIKNTILSNPSVKTIYDELVWLSDTFKDEQFPINIARVSLDLPHHLNVERVISEDPSIDPECRFNDIVDSLKTMDQKNLLHKVPKLPTDEKDIGNGQMVGQIYTDFLIFIHELTGLDIGFFNFIISGWEDHSKKLTFVPYALDGLHKSPTSTKRKIDAFSKTNLNALEKLPEFNIWTGFKIDGKINLIANPESVPTEILDYWILHFCDWILKECIISDSDIDSLIDIFPLLDKLKETKNFQTAKSIKKSLDFKKSYWYEELNKLRVS